MEFGWNDEQESLWTEIYEFAQNDIKRDLIERDHQNIFLDEKEIDIRTIVAHGYQHECICTKQKESFFCWRSTFVNYQQ